jgi:hypothetical protein
VDYIRSVLLLFDLGIRGDFIVLGIFYFDDWNFIDRSWHSGSRLLGRTFGGGGGHLEHAIPDLGIFYARVQWKGFRIDSRLIFTIGSNNLLGDLAVFLCVCGVAPGAHREGETLSPLGLLISRNLAQRRGAVRERWRRRARRFAFTARLVLVLASYATSSLEDAVHARAEGLHREDNTLYRKKVEGKKKKESKKVKVRVEGICTRSRLDINLRNHLLRGRGGAFICKNEQMSLTRVLRKDISEILSAFVKHAAASRWRLVEYYI